MSSTNSRTHSPLTALIVCGILVIIFIPIEAYLPSGFTIVGNVAVWFAGATPLVTAIAALAFPFTQKTMFNSAPISKYKWLFLAAAAIMVLILVTVLGLYGAYPALEISLGNAGYTIIALDIIGAAIWYFAFRVYQKRRGIDVDLAFRQLPVE